MPAAQRRHLNETQPQAHAPQNRQETSPVRGQMPPASRADGGVLIYGLRDEDFIFL